MYSKWHGILDRVAKKSMALPFTALCVSVDLHLAQAYFHLSTQEPRRLGKLTILILNCHLLTDDREVTESEGKN